MFGCRLLRYGTPTYAASEHFLSMNSPEKVVLRHFDIGRELEAIF